MDDSGRLLRWLKQVGGTSLEVASNINPVVAPPSRNRRGRPLGRKLRRNEVMEPGIGTKKKKLSVPSTVESVMP